MTQIEFLKEILTENEIADLKEILNFSLNPKIDLEKLQEKIAYANYYQAKLLKILYKIKLIHADLEIEFEIWHANQFQSILENYDGYPELLKTPKDFEREIKKIDEYKLTKSLLKKLEQTIVTLQTKEKELSSFDWKVKGIIDLHKIKYNLTY